MVAVRGYAGRVPYWLTTRPSVLASFPFVKHDALQCGFCTPGMILTAYGLLAQNPRPTLEQITEGMDENLCRCGSYRRIIQAIQDAIGEMKGGPVR
jgi:aerobic-type carbon monoxide dehydrogenase small subunit (CoxS/CutS family)